MEWTSELINIYFFPRNAIPADITSGNPDPRGWGKPTANFESKYGDCDIDANFPPQTIVSFSSVFSFRSFRSTLSEIYVRLTP